MSSLPAFVRHGYGVGALSFALANTTILFFLLKFLVDEARLAPAVAGTVILVAKVWDAVIDPVIGRLTDRTGGRRPWIAVATLPLAVCFASLWWGLPVTGMVAAVAYAGLLIVYNTAFSAAVIPYGALTPGLATDYDERTRLNAARMGWSMVGGIVAGIGVPLLVGEGGWRLAGSVLAVAMIPPLVVTSWATRGREAPASASPAGGLPWEVLRNPAFRRVALLFVAAWSSIAVLSALVPFYAQHQLGAKGIVDGLFAAIQLSALACIPAVAWLAGRVQKHVAYALGMGMWAVVLVALAAVPAGGTTLALGIAVLTGPGVAAAHVLPWAMLPDVVEADRAETGVDRAGDFYGMMTFLEQVATAVALWALGTSLGIAGYVEGAETQGEAARGTIRLLIGPAPGLVLLMAALYAWRWPPLTREGHAAARGRWSG
jgi:GPH family glycoside/pentoside/hexuronide:cation symporter